jgi:hypothetical protein
MIRLLTMATLVLASGCYSSHTRFSDAETEPDPVIDTIVPDCPTDWVGECVSSTGGDCNIIEQCGCCPGEACAFRLDPGGCDFIERCVGASSGTLNISDECSGGNRCPDGSICLIYLPETTIGHCFEWCEDDSDCRLADETCDLPSRFDDDASICPDLREYPYPLCSDGTFVPPE